MKSKNKFIILIGCVLVFSLAFTFLRPTPIYFQIPKGWPKPNYDFSKNPLTEEGFQLGRKDLPWDLAAQVDWIQTPATDSKNPLKQEEERLWIKEIDLVGDRETSLQILCEELKKILQANGKE